MCESKYTFSASFEGPCGALSLLTQNLRFGDGVTGVLCFRASRDDDVAAVGLNSLRTLPQAS